jgi:hypothetical protein
MALALGHRLEHRFRSFDHLPALPGGHPEPLGQLRAIGGG